jgi:hypothetical protein
MWILWLIGGCGAFVTLLVWIFPITSERGEPVKGWFTFKYEE